MLQPKNTLSNQTHCSIPIILNKNITFPLITQLSDQPLFPGEQMMESNSYVVEPPTHQHQTEVKRTRILYLVWARSLRISHWNDD